MWARGISGVIGMVGATTDSQALAEEDISVTEEATMQGDPVMGATADMLLREEHTVAAGIPAEDARAEDAPMQHHMGAAVILAVMGVDMVVEDMAADIVRR